MLVTYVGVYEAVITAAGRVEHGESLEVPDDLGEALVANGTFTATAPAKKTPTKKTTTKDTKR